ncbi:MFS transporter [Actinoplanes sp. NPDC051851]|uniref:MFS transporter n=1 Tax=Actinoplanes sp. NPDC051851 TaxID=3154753 RepID=UPI0034380A76
MLLVLRHRTFRHLFAAQVVALVGTGLATVALSLLAYDIAGDHAGPVLGTALAIKMVAYVALGPAAAVLAERVPRRALLAGMDVIRAGVALSLPFVTHIWQIHLLVFALQAASAIFTPTFQASIPEVLPDERDYTQALSLSRMAYDLESLFSPALATLLLTVVSYRWLFTGTALGLIGSALLVVSVALPAIRPVKRSGGLSAGAAFGTRLFRATPRLRALLALDLAVAGAGAIVFVNTVVVVREVFGRPASAVSLALGAYGAGSLLAALVLPRVLRRISDRRIMLVAGFVLPAVTAAVATATGGAPAAWKWALLLVCWAGIGAAGSAVLTPGGRVVRRSAADADLPAAFAAQFSLSHGCWLVTYPLAGWLAAGAGVPVTAVVLAGISLAAVAAAAIMWPAVDPGVLPHVHTDLPAGHPHLVGAKPGTGGFEHGHAFVIDDCHAKWPSAA